jgi:hypothetical protein
MINRHTAARNRRIMIYVLVGVKNEQTEGRGTLSERRPYF